MFRATPEHEPLLTYDLTIVGAARVATVSVLAMALAGCASSSAPTIDVSPQAHSVAERFADAVVHRDLAQARRLMRGKDGLLRAMVPIMNQHSVDALTDRGRVHPCAADGSTPRRRCFFFGAHGVRKTRVYDSPGGKLIRTERHPLSASILVEVSRDAHGRFVSGFLYSEP